jgi:nicotinamide-nucleotide amidase
MEMPATNIKQATLIPSSEVIPNRRGTAPGWWVEEDGKIIVAMPGPPNELQSIWEEEVAPRLRQRVRGEVILTRNIKTTGLSEGGLDEMVAEYLGKENPYLGIYAKADGIHLRIIARAPDEETARSLIRPVEEGLSSIVGPYIWGYDDETPEEAVGQLLMEKKLTLATTECCTGGLLASNITDSPDSDSYFKGGIVVYGDGSAVATGVPAGVIESFGLASQEAAEAMALVSRARLRADIGIGVAGMAGPDEMPCSPGGGSIDPWGLTHIAIALPPESPGDDNLRYFPSRLPPRRSVIKRRAASTALIELRRVLNAL